MAWADCWRSLYHQCIYCDCDGVRSHRDISAVWAWLLVLLLLPFVGFLIYFVFGRKLRADRMQDLMTQRLLGINDLVVQQQEALAAGQPLIGTPGSGGVSELV